MALLVTAVACGGASQAGEGGEGREGGEASPPQPTLGPLGLLIPAGAQLVVTARPADLMAADSTRSVIDAVFGPDQRDAFARRNGVEPHEIEEVVVAEYEHGFVILAKGPWSARDLVVATATRMTSVEVSTDEPFVRRSGFLGTERRDITAVDEHTVLFTAGVPDLTAAILGRVRRGPPAPGAGSGTGEAAVPALQAPDLAPLYARHEAAALALYAPEPLELPPGLGASLLLARQRALLAVVGPGPGDSLAFGVHLVGEFPPGAPANFETLVRSMASTDLGAAFGIREGLETLHVEVDEEAAIMGLEVPAETLALGLRLVFGGEIAELLAVPGGAL
ncbi:MAG: hypothetical protein JRH11_22630 [Deltaproteobacteria bacterium]|nr:hypothetical protein [Deltaproteobacteria bacterium]